MNNVIKIQNIRRQTNVNVAEIVAKTVAGIVSGTVYAVEYVIYAIAYVMYSVNSFARSKTARGMVIFYKRYLRVWVLSLAAFIVAGKLGGIAWVIVASALLLPVCLICHMISLPSKKTQKTTKK